MPASTPVTNVNLPGKEGVIAAHLIDEVEKGLTATPDLAGRLQEPNLPAARDVADRMCDLLLWVGSRVTIAEVKSPGEEEVDLQRWAYRALLRNYGAFNALRQGQTKKAAAVLLLSWVDEVAGLGAEPSPDEASGGRGAWQKLRNELVQGQDFQRTSNVAEPESLEWLVLFSQAVEEVISRSVAEGDTRNALRSLMTHLDLGQDDLGRLFGVSGETVRRWERGKSRIPSERGAAILAAVSALRRQLEVFRPDRLARVVRRKAGLFDGETALEWILRGRIDEVVERYDRTFAYQT